MHSPSELGGPQHLRAWADACPPDTGLTGSNCLLKCQRRVQYKYFLLRRVFVQSDSEGLAERLAYGRHSVRVIRSIA